MRTRCLPGRSKTSRSAATGVAAATAAAAALACGVAAPRASADVFLLQSTGLDLGTYTNFMNGSGGTPTSAATVYGAGTNLVVGNGYAGTFSAASNGGSGMIGTSDDIDVGGYNASYGGTGTLSITGGSLSTTAYFNLGRFVGGGTGIVNQTGGTVTAGNSAIGYAAAGTYNATGGFYTVTGSLQVDGFSGSLGTLAGTSVLNVNGGNVIVNGFFSDGGASLGAGLVNVSSGSLVSGGDLNVADVTGSTGTLVVSGGAVIGVTVYVGKGSTSGPATGTLNVSGGTVTATGNLYLGLYGTATANLTGGTVTTPGSIYLGNSSTGSAAVTVAGGNLIGSTSTSTVLIGSAASGTATVTLASGNVSSGYFIDVGNAGTGLFNVNGGAVTAPYLNVADNAGSKGTLTLTAGTVNLTTQAYIGKSGVGVLNMTGGTFNTSGPLSLGTNYNGTGTVNLAGGTLAVPAVVQGAGLSAFNFSGGTLQATANSTAFLAGVDAVRVLAGGGTIDTQGFNVTVGNSIIGSGGGLTKIGTGRLTITGTNSFNGGVQVNGGTLVLASQASNLGPGLTSVNAGGTLAGTGPTAGSVSVFTGGTITTGSGPTAADSVGEIELNNLGLAGGTYAVKYNASSSTVATGVRKGTSARAGSGIDELLVEGGLTTTAGTGTLTINPVQVGSFPAPAAGQQYSYVIAADFGSPTAFDAALAAGAFKLAPSTVPGVSYQLDAGPDVTGLGSGNEDLFLEISTAPEPTSLLLLAAAGAPLALARRRRTAAVWR